MAQPLVFNVYRQQPELITPANPTPHHFKSLSDIDDQEGLRVQLPLIFFYGFHPSMAAIDPVRVLKQSLSHTLVFYYPFAGRIRERPNRKLVVECTGEGILFVEASADVGIERFGDLIRPPFPCFDELLFDLPETIGIVNCPLMLVQATRLTCGGIVVAIRYNHTMSDATGIFQFWSTVGEMARGSRVPTVHPIWDRHRLNARDIPSITRVHDEYTDLLDTEKEIPLAEKDHRSFFFGKNEISSLRRYVPPHLGPCTRYEIITASMWRCRTIALQPKPEDEMRIISIVNARRSFNPPIPKGYYGNCIAYSVAKAKARDLFEKSIGYEVELIRNAKAKVTEEYMRLVADLMVIKGRPRYAMALTFLVSGTAQLRFDQVDLGWGPAVFGGPAKGHVASFHIAHRNKSGEDGILVTLCLPKLAMQRFVRELDGMLKTGQQPPGDAKNTLPSAL